MLTKPKISRIPIITPVNVCDNLLLIFLTNHSNNLEYKDLANASLVSIPLVL